MTDSSVQLCDETPSSDEDEELISYLQTPKYSFTSVDKNPAANVINKLAQNTYNCETKSSNSNIDGKAHILRDPNVNSMDTVVLNSDEKPLDEQNMNNEVVNYNLVSCADSRNIEQNGDETNSYVPENFVTDASIVTNNQTEVKPFLRPDTTVSNLIPETCEIHRLSDIEKTFLHSAIELMSQLGKTSESASKEDGDCSRLPSDLSVEMELKLFLNQAEESGQAGKEKYFIITEHNWSALCEKVRRMINVHQGHKKCATKDVGTDTNNLAIEECTNNTGRFVRRNNKLVFERVIGVPAHEIEKSASDDFTPNVQVSEHLHEYSSTSQMNIDSILLSEDQQQVILNGNIDVKEAFDTTNCQVIAYSTKHDSQVYGNNGTKMPHDTCHSPEFTAQPVVFNIDESGELQIVNCSSPKLLLNTNVSNYNETQADIEELVESNLIQSCDLSSNLEPMEDVDLKRNGDSVKNENSISKHHSMTDIENLVKTETKQENKVSSAHFLCKNKEINTGQIKRKLGEVTEQNCMKSDQTKVKMLKTTPTHTINLRSRNSKPKLILKRTDCRNRVQKSKSVALSEAKLKRDEEKIKITDDSGDAKLESKRPKVEFIQAIELDSQLSNTNGKFGDEIKDRISAAYQEEKEANPEDSEIDIESDLENYFSAVKSSKEACKDSVDTQAELDCIDDKNYPPTKKHAKSGNRKIALPVGKRAKSKTSFEHKSIIKKDSTKNLKQLSDSGLEEEVEFSEGATSIKQELLKKKTFKSKHGKIVTTRSRMRNERIQNKKMQKSTKQNNEEKLGYHGTSKKKRTWKIRFEKSVSFENDEADENGSDTVSPTRKQKALFTGLLKEVTQNGKQRKASKGQINDSNYDLGNSQEGMVTISHGITLKNVSNIETKNKSASASKDDCQTKQTCRIETAEVDGRKKKTLSDSQSDEKRNTKLPKIMKLRKQRIRYEQNKWKELLTCEMMDIQRDVEQLDHDLKGPLNVRKVIKGILKTAKLKSKQNLKRDSKSKSVSKREVSNQLENPKSVGMENNKQNENLKAVKKLTKQKRSSNSNSIVLAGDIPDRLHKRNNFSLEEKQVCAPKSKCEANGNLKLESQFENDNDSVLKPNLSNAISVSTKPVSDIGLSDEKAMFDNKKVCFEIHESPTKTGIQECFQQFVLISPKGQLDHGDLTLQSPVLNVKHFLPANTAVSPSKAADKLKDLLTKATSVRKIVLN
ncbi:uncharacterized protein LOC127844371 [Dreissena polymorpha]|uniref:Uncharacterized protein n=1 Tax=Dreissena polymorpha TaxID=45954 RepID=A0A9D4EDR6_DREPO|nr:uncharacterized protein LOC127844371 [Dreissena polymorpha]KAH3778704.1 hypothetical protein DPMN_180174 [Dreissena polymorpha]